MARHREGADGTIGRDYTERLGRLGGARWKQVLDVQAPYRHNVRRVCTGRVLDVGCGIGRNLEHLGPGAVGVDHNAFSVETARSRGLEAYTPDEFAATDLARPGSFDTILVAHVLEHVDRETGDALLASYLPFLRRPGSVVLICPQEKGFASDATHVRWVDDEELGAQVRRLGGQVVSSASFPFPRMSGKVFPYNEFVVVGRID